MNVLWTGFGLCIIVTVLLLGFVVWADEWFRQRLAKGQLSPFMLEGSATLDYDDANIDRLIALERERMPKASGSPTYGSSDWR